MSGFVRFPALPLAFAFCCCTLCATAHAQASVDTSTLAGIPLTKTVRSMRDIRYIDIPETELIRRMMVFSSPDIVVKNGFSMLDMKKFVETIGLRGRGFRVNTDALYHLQIPVMVLMNIDGYEHFVIVKHAENGRVFIADPALGNRILLEEDFSKTWNGLVFAVVGKPFGEDSPLLQDNESLALKLRAGALATGGATTPFVEYGLTRAELF